MDDSMLAQHPGRFRVSKGSSDVNFDLSHTHTRRLTANAPQKNGGCLEDDPASYMGPGNFSGANSLLNFGRVPNRPIKIGRLDPILLAKAVVFERFERLKPDRMGQDDQTFDEDVFVSIGWPNHHLVCLFACLPVCLFACLFVCSFVCLSVCLFVCLLVCWFVGLFVSLFVYLFVCLFIRLFFCLFDWAFSLRSFKQLAAWPLVAPVD